VGTGLIADVEADYRCITGPMLRERHPVLEKFCGADRALIAAAIRAVRPWAGVEPQPVLLLAGILPIGGSGFVVVVVEDNFQAVLAARGNELVKLRHRAGIVQALVDPIDAHAVDAHRLHRGDMAVNARERPGQLHAPADNVHAVQPDTGNANGNAITADDLAAANAQEAFGKQLWSRRRHVGTGAQRPGDSGDDHDQKLEYQLVHVDISPSTHTCDRLPGG
jgi:hypothetical protein